ncbi:hypothetical protein [Stieleria varia]|uniref:Uncharacterized protein n=1 Tax=Stieleria varia TaxID=2528005 RepID=A0A5C6AFQ6_9BACT|nr:hypothetical protein [Stieleria varia]TWT98270.1 hypothetical protein Pla52n_47800 [Stieleria varia]
MITASELAGMFAAHAVWCVSDGDTLIPMLVFTDENGGRQMERLAHDDLGAAVEYGRNKLASNDMDANDAALIYDGRITLGEEKLDALIIEMRTYFSPASVAAFAIPYTPKDSGRFRVHKPKVLAWDNCEDFDLDHAFEAFFAGVAGHEKGSAIWNHSLDESK